MPLDKDITIAEWSSARLENFIRVYLANNPAGDRTSTTTATSTTTNSDVLGYAEKTSNTTLTVGGGYTTIATAPEILFDGSTPILIEIFGARAGGGGGTNETAASIFDNGSGLAVVWYDTSGGSSGCSGYLRITPTAGTHTYSLRASTSGSGTDGTFFAGNGTGGANAPAFIRIARS